MHVAKVCTYTTSSNENVFNKGKVQMDFRREQWFIALKKIVGHDVIIFKPNLSEGFIIHTDSRKMNISWVTIQNGKPIAFYSRNLTPEK